MTTPRKPRPRPATARAGGAATASAGRRASAPPRDQGQATTLGRPPASGEARTVELRVRLTPAEHARLLAVAGAGGVSAYVRAQLGMGDDG